MIMRKQLISGSIYSSPYRSVRRHQSRQDLSTNDHLSIHKAREGKDALLFSLAAMAALQFFALLMLLLIACSTAQFVPTPPVNVTITIRSEMGDATTLSVHCRAFWGGPPIPILDLGLHQLRNEELYAFSFLEDTAPELDRRVYMCDCAVVGWHPVHQFYVHRSHSCECVHGQCPLRVVKPAGFFCGDVQVGTWSS